MIGVIATHDSGVIPDPPLLNSYYLSLIFYLLTILGPKIGAGEAGSDSETSRTFFELSCVKISSDTDGPGISHSSNSAGLSISFLGSLRILLVDRTRTGFSEKKNYTKICLEGLCLYSAI